MRMAPSILRSFTVPQIGTAGASPTCIAQAGANPTRVIVRNTTLAVAALLAHDINDLTSAASSSFYRIPSRSADVFLLAPGQSLHAMGEAGAATLSLAISEAFPVSVKG